MQINKDYLDKFQLVQEDNRRIIGDTIYEYFGKKHGNKIFPLFSKYDHSKIKEAFLLTEKEGSKEITHFLKNLNRL